MELIRGLVNLKARHRGCVASIGNFDGVHLGHREIVRMLTDRGREAGLPAVVVTFETTPQEYFNAAAPPARLMTLREKYQALAACGVQRLLCLRFNRALAELPAETFIEHVLVRDLGVRQVVVGEDFRFGRGRTGDFALLKTAGGRYGFGVSAAITVMQGGERVSSTRIRACLAAGDLEVAAKLLGRPFSLSGRVSHGARLGRQLGFPTANIALRRRVAPVRGIFVARVQGADAGVRYGAAYVGSRPAVGGLRTVLEVFLFDFDATLYGRRLRVELLARLRDDARFENLESLREQIVCDVQAARAWLNGRNLQ
ncbi:MAG TPA: bifunctional riboflavin kinase/FAD synthetase [Gammaproteobacteria bacterium]|nr:bifunctional riboflavin kinase/FAD synthetase [Gammaproteobacteria bacterium]